MESPSSNDGEAVGNLVGETRRPSVPLAVVPQPAYRERRATALQQRRARAIPPLPKVLSDLHHGCPCFEEASGEAPHPNPFPERLAALKPLTLRGAGGQRSGGGATPTQSAAASGTPSACDESSSGEASIGTDGQPAGSACSTAATSAKSFLTQAAGLIGAPAPADAAGRASGSAGGGANAPMRVGLVLAGERQSQPAPPVNIAAGLLAYLSRAAPGSVIVGFLGGPEGLLNGWCRDLHPEEVLETLNQGGWPLLSYGSCNDGSFAVEDRAEEAKRAMAVCSAQRLNGLVIVAGPKDLSWAAALSANFDKAGCSTSIVGVPHSKNLNLYVPHYMPITLGFDSAARMLSEIAGNTFIDSLSSNKYWHFLRSGEDALTMEVALQTRCTFSQTTVDTNSGGVNEEGTSLMDAVGKLREVILRRRSIGRPSGVVLLSRHLIETLPEMAELKRELVEILGDVAVKGKPPSLDTVQKQLKKSAQQLFKRLPRFVQLSLVLKRDADGMPLLPTELEAERILGRFVQQELKLAGSKGPFAGPFAPRFHSMELMSSAPLPSPLDCALGFTLGQVCGALVLDRRNFYVATCANLHKPAAEWEPCAVPFSFLYPDTATALASREELSSCLMSIPKRGWRLRRNITEVYRHFRTAWVECNVFKSPGPLQFGEGGDIGAMSDRPFTLLAEYLTLDELKRMVQPVVDMPPPLPIYREPRIVRDVRVKENLSRLERMRLGYSPALPSYLRRPVRAQEAEITPMACESNDGLVKAFPLSHGQPALELVPMDSAAGDPAQKLTVASEQKGAITNEPTKPLRVGLVFASNQVPGFHSVAAGLFDSLTELGGQAEVVGFLCGFDGLIKNLTVRVTAEIVDQYRHLGGQDMLCQFSAPASLANKSDLQAVTTTIRKQKLDGLVLAGSLQSQVDAAFITEACAAERLPTRVVGVPVSLECNIPFVQQTVGHDTVCRTLSSYAGNIGKLAESHGNMWVFVRIVGDAYSHVAVECTLQTHLQMVLLAGSQLLGQSLPNIVKILCDLIVERHKAGLNFGTVLIPVGFVMDIMEMRLLFAEVTEILSSGSYDHGWDSIHDISARLKPNTAAIFDIMPRDVQYEICFGGRERHTNKVDLSNISTDRLLLRLVEVELQRRRQLGLLGEDFFKGICYPMVYQARSAIPTNFDCDLAYTLGWGAALLVKLGRTGQLIHVSGLEGPPSRWCLKGLPMVALLSVEADERTMEERIKPAPLYLLKNRSIKRPFKRLPAMTERVTMYKGPIQYGEPTDEDPSLRRTWFMETMGIQDPAAELTEIAKLCAELQSAMAKAKNDSTLLAVNSLLSNALSVLDACKQFGDSRDKRQSLADIPIEEVPDAWVVRRNTPQKCGSPALQPQAPPQAANFKRMTRC